MIDVGDVADRIVSHRRLIVVGLLAITAAMAVGAGQVDDSSSLDQFETDSTEVEKLDYVRSNFTADGNTTTVQVIVREDNVLEREALLEQLRFQRSLTEDGEINATLSDERPATGVANVIATTAIRERQGQNLTERGRALQAERERLNRTGQQLSDALNRTRELQGEYERLNRSYAAGEIDEPTYRERSAAIEENLTATRERATANLSANQTATFGELFGETRALQSELAAANASLAAGEINESTYRERVGEIQAEFATVYERIEAVLAPDAERLEARAAALQRDQAAFQQRIENGSRPPLSDQIDRLEAMNGSAVNATIEGVLGEDSDAGAFGLMASGYDPGSTTAEATMIVVTQSVDASASQGVASDRAVDSQLAIRDAADDRFADAMVFGAGIVSDEMNRSMSDSMAIVGPFALAFVLVVLTIAYRDPLDILLGVVGIGVVLIWTFGFMGWADIAFNQIFIAIPVLLIGLSIDYAIHVFMRHREQRTDGDETADASVAADGGTDADGTDEADGETDGAADEGVDPHSSNGARSVGGAMRIALAGVGVALVLVTATTVIGFLSNLTSPVAPIREFGVVSAVGIVSALVVFGALVPGLKVEFDRLLEGFGFDRRKRAFGTGGGVVGGVLSAGATAARRAPWAVIALTLLISAAGAYGATGVDTSFENEDFIAEEPPEWTDRLPAAMQPGEYRIRGALEYVNDNFVREDATVEFLFEGDVTDADALDRVNRTGREVADRPVAATLPNGEADVRSPLTVMESVAATNETFNETYRAADTDGDGVPDENVTAVYDALFDASPDRAGEVIHREDGEYRALRLTASLDGAASSSDVRDQMEDVEGIVGGGDVTVTATGQSIVNEIVQDDLLQTVVESLLVTLVVSFVFLMVVYRIVDGSATLGLVTLLPVVFNVTWILGTMYLLEIPFNVVTGMITSLTIGLGVAYSIHISERYSLELDRQETPVEAMETAVTGTGGALLGSAATTVGGFGVLVFAILPPLQQFGFITGLTIVYAFLASVFVLPSLLAVWTRRFGPADEFDPGPDGSTAPATTDEPDGAAGTTAAAGSASAAALANGHGLPAGVRTVRPRHVLPGQEVRVTVTVEDAAGRVVLKERAGGPVTIEDVSPAPVQRVATGDRAYVVWDLAETADATLTYRAPAPSGLSEGHAVAFEGELLLPDHVVPVAGEESATVTTDPAGRVLNGRVDERDLAETGDHLSAGAVTPAEFERVYHAWLDERADGTRGDD